ncbi:Glycogen debranching enzyme (alpha-1,6-glucosidase) [Lentzea xinjiangensis]|uniref:Glycogen debranching enzyme (Alpha-1,6-glucosidase) n=1 Tax=Lentzea xinjiangensis TaxID=402600 RepID=A0A1H9UI08_9PSEU|nr:glycogen debranching N-terminal domain-containing protein [Lentzea xinjiangensis]SES08908.1 Glycogen debranching enzyme (alpha-1,6-glucosidase) [Lentzea xinjiangensis]
MTDGAPQAFNGTEPVPVVGAGVVTLVEGSTFCISDPTGDIRPGGAQGLFFRDARVVSRWELRLDGQPQHPLSVIAQEAFASRFVLRRPPQLGHADSTLLVTRERLLGDGLRETITLQNLGREASAVTITLHVDADFADLFAVKEGRGHGGCELTVIGDELRLTDRGNGARGMSVSATADPLVTPGALTWRVVVPAKQRWTTEVVAQPTLANRRVQPQFHRGEGLESSGPARKIREWREASTVIAADDAVLTQVLQRTESDLGALQIHDQARGDRPFVAAGAPWFMTLFGRDSLLTAWMALPLDVGLGLGTLQTLADLQGTKVDPITEEEPGRVLHELRLGPDSARVLGGSHYYGTVDSTPLFVMLLAECWRWGAPEQTVRSLLPAADAALRWVERYGDRDGDGFVEYRRATDRGLANQGWKDSFDGVNDATGRIADTPIALCEVQGYVYAALRARAEMAEHFGDTATAARCRAAADELRQRFADRFWLPDKGWYAIALDGRKRPVDALTSNVAHCLWTGIVPDEHAAVLIERLAGKDMDSGYGLRTLSASMGAYNPMSYHNGSVWPHDTAIAVAGLLRYAHLDGAVPLAHRLATGVLDAAAAFGARLPELFCGFSRDEFSPPVPYPTSCSPQAWASAAPVLLVRSFLGLDPHVPRRTVALRPALPAAWGEVRLKELRLGPATVDITARGAAAEVQGLPQDWRLVDAPERFADAPATA